MTMVQSTVASNAWTINFGYVVSDTFTLTSASTITGFDFGVWAFPGDQTVSVDWSITMGENDGNPLASGTASTTTQFISTNSAGYDIDMIHATGLNVFLGAGTYWLNLDNAVTSQGDPLYWDENSGVGCDSPAARHRPRRAQSERLLRKRLTLLAPPSAG